MNNDHINSITLNNNTKEKKDSWDGENKINKKL